MKQGVLQLGKQHIVIEELLAEVAECPEIIADYEE